MSALSAEEPVLSAVVVIVSDTLQPRAQTTHLAACLEALREQIDAPPFEIIVPYHGQTDGIEALRDRFREARFVAVPDDVARRETPGRDHHDVLRSRGLAIARGTLVALLEDHARPDAHWCASMLRAYRQSGAGAVGGAIENGVDRALAWAVYYCDFARYQNPVPEGPSLFASDANTAYKREALETIRPLWQETFREDAVNGALLSSGQRLVLCAQAIVHQRRSDLSLGRALCERFVWARSYARTRSERFALPKRLVYAIGSLPVLPALLFYRMTVVAWQRKRHFRKFVAAAPLAALLLCGWSAGECAGYLAAPGKR